MKRSERAARARLTHQGITVTNKGSVVGNLKRDDQETPTTTLKYGIISRLLGTPPKEERK